MVKNLFRHRKTHYKGLAKNTGQLFTLFGFAYLVLARRWFVGRARPKVRPENRKWGIITMENTLSTSNPACFQHWA